MDVHLERLKGVRDPDGSNLLMESVLWASERFDRSATTANSSILSPHEVFSGGRPPMPVLPFCKPVHNSVPRQSKMIPVHPLFKAAVLFLSPRGQVACFLRLLSSCL